MREVQVIDCCQHGLRIGAGQVDHPLCLNESAFVDHVMMHFYISWLIAVASSIVAMRIFINPAQLAILSARHEAAVNASS